MKKIVVAGAGAHCKVVLDQLLSAGEYEVVGLLDRCEESELLGVPVLGGDELMEQLYQRGVHCGFVAIGNNAVREKVTAEMERIGYEMVTVVSRHATVSRFAVIEAGSLIMPGAIVNACAHIGKGCILNTNCSIDHDCEVGDFVHIAPGCAVSGTTTIGMRSFLGTGARAIDRITIGHDVMLGAGAVAVSDIPDGCTAVGVPAKVIKGRTQNNHG